jgi:hypothetical protein
LDGGCSFSLKITETVLFAWLCFYLCSGDLSKTSIVVIIAGDNICRAAESTVVTEASSKI